MIEYEIRMPKFHAKAHLKFNKDGQITEKDDCYFVPDNVSFNAWLGLILQDYVMKSVTMENKTEQNKINEMLKEMASWKVTEYFGDVVFKEWQDMGAPVPCDCISFSKWILDDESELELSIKIQKVKRKDPRYLDVIVDE